MSDTPDLFFVYIDKFPSPIRDHMMRMKLKASCHVQQAGALPQGLLERCFGDFKGQMCVATEEAMFANAWAAAATAGPSRWTVGDYTYPLGAGAGAMAAVDEVESSGEKVALILNISGGSPQDAEVLERLRAARVHFYDINSMFNQPYQNHAFAAAWAAIVAAVCNTCTRLIYVGGTAALKSRGGWMTDATLRTVERETFAAAMRSNMAVTVLPGDCDPVGLKKLLDNMVSYAPRFFTPIPSG